LATVSREDAIVLITDEVRRLQGHNPVRMVVDGLSATGKTTLAGEVRGFLETEGVPVLRASLDDFKRPWSESHLYDRVSGEGYYRNAYDHECIVAELLEPLNSVGDRTVRTALRNPLTGLEPANAIHRVDRDVVLVVDGVFALRPELRTYWDLSVFLTMPFNLVLQRGADRDQAWEDSWECAAQLYRDRYIPSERLYIEEVDPMNHADFVFDMTDPTAPVLLRP
jgi:uridine kinase